MSYEPPPTPEKIRAYCHAHAATIPVRMVDPDSGKWRSYRLAELDDYVIETYIAYWQRLGITPNRLVNGDTRGARETARVARGGGLIVMPLRRVEA